MQKITLHQCILSHCSWYTIQCHQNITHQILEPKRQKTKTNLSSYFFFSCLTQSYSSQTQSKLTKVAVLCLNSLSHLTTDSFVSVTVGGSFWETFNLSDPLFFQLSDSSNCLIQDPLQTCSVSVCSCFTFQSMPLCSP